MRIAMFSDCYRPVINGVVTSIACLRAALEKAGHDVWLFVPDYPNSADLDTHLIRFHSWPFALHPEDRFSLPLPLAHLKTFFQLNADVVHIHTPFNLGFIGLALARLQGVPVVFTHHTLWEEYIHYVPLPKSFMRWFAVNLCKFFCQRARRVVAPGDEIRIRLRQQAVTRPIDVIPTGIDVEVFQGGDAEHARQELGLDGSETVFLYVGRMAREKSIDFVLRAFSQAASQGPNSRLVLVGDGPERQALAEQARTLGVGDRTCFPGYRPREDLKHYMALARAFLFSSQTETQGLVLLEAQAAGVPIIGIKASGVNEAVSAGRTGLLHQPGDLKGFVESLCRLAKDDELYSKMSQEARRWASAFSAELMANRMERAYQGTFGSKTGSEPSESLS